MHTNWDIIEIWLQGTSEKSECLNHYLILNDNSDLNFVLSFFLAMQLCFLLIINFTIPIIYCAKIESYWSPMAYKYYIASKWGNTDLTSEVY